eukprot:4752157-Heterocapsa_arctica.AAC.1
MYETPTSFIPSLCQPLRSGASTRGALADCKPNISFKDLLSPRTLLYTPRFAYCILPKRRPHGRCINQGAR